MTVKITLYIASSKDSFIATKDGGVAWLDKFNNLGEDYGYNKFIESINTVVMGNTTYEQVLSFGEYPYKDKKSFVFSNNKQDNNITFVRGNVKEFIDSLDKKKKHNIFLVGGANIINQFIEYDLIDEYIIFTMPEVLGKGISLFSKQNKNLTEKLILKKTKTWPSGVIESEYIKK